MTPIEWIEVACFGIGATLMAADEALRRGSRIRARIPWLRLRGALRFVPLAFFVPAAVLATADHMELPIAVQAKIGLAVFFLSVVGILYAFRRDVAADDRSALPVTVATPPIVPFARGIAVFTDDLDRYHTKLVFTPTRDISRLRIFLDLSYFDEGGMGALPAWSARRRSAVPMRLPDLGPGVQQNRAADGDRRTRHWRCPDIANFPEMGRNRNPDRPRRTLSRPRGASRRRRAGTAPPFFRGFLVASEL